jgi:hypothetical protein
VLFEAQLAAAANLPAVCWPEPHAVEHAVRKSADLCWLAPETVNSSHVDDVNRLAMHASTAGCLQHDAFVATNC